MTDPFSAPPWSRRIWADSQSIFLEIPTTSGPPFIQKYSKSDGGLSKALELISLAFEAQASLGTYSVPRHPLVNRPKPGIKTYSEGSRNAARAVLKKLGLIGADA